MGYSDRVIRLYKWIGPTTFDSETEAKGSMVQIEKWQLAGQVIIIVDFRKPKTLFMWDGILVSDYK